MDKSWNYCACEYAAHGQIKPCGNTLVLGRMYWYNTSVVIRIYWGMMSRGPEARGTNYSPIYPDHNWCTNIIHRLKWNTGNVYLHETHFVKYLVYNLTIWHLTKRIYWPIYPFYSTKRIYFPIYPFYPMYNEKYNHAWNGPVFIKWD